MTGSGRARWLRRHQKGNDEAVLRAAGQLENLAWAVWDPYTSQALRQSDARVLTTGKDVVNGLNFQVANPSSLKDRKKAKVIEDYLGRLRRAQDWVYRHPEKWAKVWGEETGLPHQVALDSAPQRRPHRPHRPPSRTPRPP